MRDKEQVVSAIRETGIVAIMRASSAAQMVDAARAMRDGGVSVIEVSLVTPGALDVVRQVRNALSDVVMGAGTITDIQSAEAAVNAGSEFIVCPVLDLEVIEYCRGRGVVVLPGALTPTEILAAWRAGADLVKLFPACPGGPELVEAIRGPLPQVPLVAVGGVTVDNVGDFFRAGCVAVGVGGSLVKKQHLADRNFAAIAALTRRFVDAVATARRR